MKESKTDQVSKAPLVGKIFSILSGLGFFVVVMLLPLVGQAGSKTEHALLNANTFMTALLLTIVFSMACIRVTVRVREEGTPAKTPWITWSISVMCTLLLLAKITGMLKI
jgi:magnesium-transporting ATPase (P-type)